LSFDTGAITNYILDLADRDGVPVSPMKLQKLLYYSHGWYLAIANEALLDEHVEAWKWGPVIPSVYHEFKECGNDPIGPKRFTKVALGSYLGRSRIHFNTPKIDDCPGDTERAKAVTGRVWHAHKDITAIRLSMMTHQPGSPWDIAWKESGGRRGTDISDDLIKEHFKKLLEAQRSA
jgi:uncharacterized phage-associated protein